MEPRRLQSGRARDEPVTRGIEPMPEQHDHKPTPDPDVTAYLLRRVRRAHIAGGRRDLDVVIVDGEWYRDVLELLNRIDVKDGQQ